MADFTDYVDAQIDAQRLMGFLTQRQRQIMCLLANGYSGPQAAAEVGITHQAVYSVRRRARKIIERHVACLVVR